VTEKAAEAKEASSQWQESFYRLKEDLRETKADLAAAVAKVSCAI
jgi:hypothetical protein